MPFRFSLHGDEIEIPLAAEEIEAAEEIAEELRAAVEKKDGPGAGEIERGPWRALREAVRQRENARLRETNADSLDCSGDHSDSSRIKIGHFELIETIGHGGMGVVFRALDPRMGRTVALKLWSEKLPSVHGGGPDPLAEVRALARLAHPNVVSIHDIGEYEGHLYLVLEDVRGIDADGWLALGWRDVLFVYIRVGRGLAAAHDAGILHNDVKPSNVLLGEKRQVKVSDFGLAASMPRAEDSAGGTPLYMAPDERRSPASDQFSLCVSIYEALYGTTPFVGRSYLEMLLAMERGELQVGSRQLPGIPERLRAAVLKGLALDPGERHESVTALVAELERCLTEADRPPMPEAESGADDQGERVRSRPASQPTLEPPRGLFWLLALVIITGPLLGMGVTLGVQEIGSRHSSAPPTGASMLVSMLTEAAVLLAKHGDGEPALSLLAAAQARARDPSLSSDVTEQSLRLVAETADVVGMRLFEAEKWTDAVRAHDLAAGIHQTAGRKDMQARSLELVRFTYKTRDQMGVSHP